MRLAFAAAVLLGATVVASPAASATPGGIAWTDTYQPSSGAAGSSVAADQSLGRVYIGGTTTGTTNHPFVRALTSTGTRLWVFVLPVSGTGRQVVVDGSGNIYLLIARNQSGRTTTSVAAFTPQANHLWTVDLTVGTSSTDVPVGLVVTNNFVFVAGTTQTSPSDSTTRDFFIGKIKKDGTHSGTSTFGTAGVEDSAVGIASAGSYVAVAGTGDIGHGGHGFVTLLYATAKGAPLMPVAKATYFAPRASSAKAETVTATQDTVVVSGESGDQLAVVAYDLALKQRWTGSYPAAETFARASDASAAAHMLVVAAQQVTPSGQNWLLLAWSLTRGGAPVWHVAAPTRKNGALPQSVVLADDGTSYIAGTQAHNGTGPDYSVLALTAQGSPIWSVSYDGGSSSGTMSDDEVGGLALDQTAQQVYVTGQSLLPGTASRATTLGISTA